MKRVIQLVIITFLIFNFNPIFSQNNSKLFVKVNLAPGFSKVSYNFTSDVFNEGRKFGINGDVQLGYTINTWFSISSGVGLGYFSSSLTMRNWSGAFSDTDIDGDDYTKYIIAENIIEDQKYILINIPLSFNFIYPLIEGVEICASVGNYFSFPLISKYEAEGSFSYSGFYEEYNVTLYDIAEYGFYEDIVINSSGKNNIKTLAISGFGSLGLRFPFSQTPVTMFIGSQLIYNFTSLNDDVSNNYFISKDHNSLNSLIGISKNTSFQFSGILLGFDYKL